MYTGTGQFANIIENSAKAYRWESVLNRLNRTQPQRGYGFRAVEVGEIELDHTPRDIADGTPYLKEPGANVKW